MKRNRKYFQIASLVLALLLSGAGLLFGTASAASAQIYVSPASSGVQSGSNVTVAVRANTGGSNADTAQVTLTYDPSKLTFVSVSTSGSPITGGANYANTGSSIAGGAYTTSPVSGDILLFSATFRANVSSGSTTLGFSTSGVYDTEIDSSGTSLGAALVGGTVSFSQPACPAGYTGTWPNCVPPTNSGGGGGSSGGGGGSGGSGNGGGGGNSGGGSSSNGQPPSKKLTPTPIPAPSQPVNVSSDPAAVPVIGTQQVQFTTASFTATTKVPTQMYVEYGTSSTNLSFKTPISSLGTTHELSLDTNALAPGVTYYYQLVSLDQQGNTITSGVQSFTAKGMTVNVGVYDSKHQPLANTPVTLHSTPYQTTTNSQGSATFNNVAPGSHTISFSEGGKTYTHPLTVANNITTVADGSQSAAPQNLAVVYTAYTATGGFPVVLTVVLVLILIAVIAVLYIFRGKLPFDFGSGGRSWSAAGAGGDDLSQQIVVGGETPPPGSTIEPDSVEKVITPEGNVLNPTTDGVVTTPPNPVANPEPAAGPVVTPPNPANPEQPAETVKNPRERE